MIDINKKLLKNQWNFMNTELIKAIICQESTIDYSSLINGDSLLYVEMDNGESHIGVYDDIGMSLYPVAKRILHLSAPERQHIEILGNITSDGTNFFLKLDPDVKYLELVGSLTGELRKAKIDSGKRKLLKDYIESEMEAGL